MPVPFLLAVIFDEVPPEPVLLELGVDDRAEVARLGLAALEAPQHLDARADGYGDGQRLRRRGWPRGRRCRWRRRGVAERLRARVRGRQPLRQAREQERDLVEHPHGRLVHDAAPRAVDEVGRAGDADEVAN